MRELTNLELRSVSGGIMQAPRRPVLEAVRRLIVRILDSILPGRPTKIAER
jgi:hypothetical protein